MAWNLVKADGKKIPTGAICLSSQNDRNGDQYLAVKDDRYLLLRNVIIIGKAAIDNVNGKHTFWYAEAGNERKTFDFFWVVPKSESCLQIKKNQDNNPGPESMKLGYENEQEYYAVIVESKNGTIPGKKSALGPAIYTYGYNVCEEWNNFYWIDLCLERDPVVPVPENLPETFWEQQIGLPRPSASHLEQMAIFVFILPTNATDQSDVISFYPNTRRGISNIMTTMTQRQLNVARILIGGRLNFARFTTMHTGTIDNLGQFRLDYQSYHLYHATENQYANLQLQAGGDNYAQLSVQTNVDFGCNRIRRAMFESLNHTCPVRLSRVDNMIVDHDLNRTFPHGRKVDYRSSYPKHDEL